MFGRNIILAAALLIASAATLQAQPAPSPARWAFGGTAGVGQTWDDESSIGTGVLAGGYAQWRWLSRTHLDFSLDYLRHERSGGHFEADGGTTFLSGAVVQRFGGRTTSGYVLGGITLAAHSGRAGLPEFGPLTTAESTGPGIVFGGGITSRVSRRLEVGPIVRMMVMTPDGDSDPAFAITGGVRIGVR